MANFFLVFPLYFNFVYGVTCRRDVHVFSGMQAWTYHSLTKIVVGPSQAAQLVKASSEVAGLIYGQGTYKNQPMDHK